ncbi:hypothetical protein [Niveibacterium terrae]|uniref:hypothetical protein n=1 Tax=Niveibacterium terrae TaxID=3373598 RepID=UPI003A94A9D5
MKRILMLFACLLGLGLTLPASAVDYAVPADPVALQQLRDRLKTDRKGVISENMKLSETEASHFWPLYGAFQRELEVLGSRRTTTLLELIQANGTVTEANAQRMYSELNAIAAADAELRQRYFAKFAKAITPIKATRYYQIEARISALNRLDENFAIPLVH